MEEVFDMKNAEKETDTVTLFLRIPESLKQLLSIQAKSNGNSINREIALCLEKKMSEAMRYLPVNTPFIKPEASMTGFTIRLPGNLKARLEVWSTKNYRSLNNEILVRLDACVGKAEHL